MTCGHKTGRNNKRLFCDPLSPLLFDRLPVWQVVGRNTQIMWNQVADQCRPWWWIQRIHYPSGLTNLGLFFFHLSTKLFGGRRIELARHQFILLNFPEQLRAHIPEVGHVSTSHGIMEESPSFILALTPHLLQLSANPDLPDTLQEKKKGILKALSDVNF